MIRWVFLDVGNILLDEDPLTFVNFRVHVEAVQKVRPDLTFGQILLEREERAISGLRWPLYEVVSRYLNEANCLATWKVAEAEIRGRYDALSPPIISAEAMIQALAPRFRLGLIANQGPECRRWLDRLGWLDLFDVVALSEEEGFFKPDPKLFQIALDRAGVEASEAIMVGDRLDNDIAPASTLGMKTAWVRWPDRAAKGWLPASPEEEAYLRSLERVTARATVLDGNDEPSIVVDDLRALVLALLDLA